MVQKRQSHTPDAPFFVSGLEPSKVEFTKPEEAADKALRREKDRWGFYIKDVGSYVAAYIIMAVILTFAIILFVRGDQAARQQAMSILVPLLTAVVGMVFGRAIK